ncbi:MAG: hypothetical protein OXG68_15705 [Chloroflexi bacterium]|nr:hypothetical protein [Chloroflexota bacterium]
MAWTTPKTWSSEPLTSIDLNTHVRDNQNHLKDRLDASASRVISGATLLSTTANDFVDVDAAKLSLALTTHGGDVLLGFTGTVRNNARAGTTNINVAVDGVDYVADAGLIGVRIATDGDSARNKPISFVMLITGLSAGSHSFKLRWKTSRNSTAHMDIVDLHPQFWAKEI